MAEEQARFEAVFEVLAAELIDQLDAYNLPAEGIAHLKAMIHSTVSGGKMNRGLTVAAGLKSILRRDLSFKEHREADILGWCVEWLQAFFLVADDIMDSSKTRRGQPCWYMLPNVGTTAINDAFILESMLYKTLKHHFKAHPCYGDIVDLFRETTYQTELGQLMDLITAPEDTVDLSKFTIGKHAYIVEYKTAYYSFYLPIALSMILAGITDERAYKKALAILLPLGEYFQVQDDFLDCYGDAAVIGKIGTDIMDNKCSWLINQALSLVSPVQRAVLDANYGRKDATCESKVKQVFLELNLEQVYKTYEDLSYQRINALINQLDDAVLPREMFVVFLAKIYKRTM